MPCGCGRGGVGEEHEQAHCRGQNGGGQRQCRQGVGAQVTNHGGIDHDKDRRGHQPAQGRQCQTQDLAVKFAPAQLVSRAGKGRVGAGSGSVAYTGSDGAATHRGTRRVTRRKTVSALGAGTGSDDAASG